MITIFTPTYNRKTKLANLANSLEIQTLCDFEWIIVDDGSTDGTEEYIYGYSKTSKLTIRYYKQENQGKHVAYNYAIEKACGAYFLCVDSDDTLTVDAVDTITEYTRSLNQSKIGCVFRMDYGNSNLDKEWSEIDRSLVDSIDLKELHNIIEFVLVFRTSIIKKYRFPMFFSGGAQEKFCPEGVLWNQLIHDGKYLAVNKTVYLAEYQEDGLTMNIYNRTWVNNFFGVMAELQLRFQIVSKYPIYYRIKSRFKCIMNVNSLCMVKKKSIIKNTPSLKWSILIYIPSVFFRYIRFR